jgi:hypothetical protein
VTIRSLANQGRSWAQAHLAQNPSHGAWGVSFVEIISAGTFTIDGRSPRWPTNGAAALWAARVELSEAAPGEAQPFLLLEFWLPDSTYVQFMRGKGHYSKPGKISLQQEDGGWVGRLEVSGLLAALVLGLGTLPGVDRMLLLGAGARCVWEESRRRKRQHAKSDMDNTHRLCLHPGGSCFRRRPQALSGMRTTQRSGKQ